MKYEKSCGCIVIDNEKVLLVKHNAGHWDFPKGHVEENETEMETAIREVKEETNVDVEIQEKNRYVIEYSHKEDTTKQVVFFIAKKINGNIKAQESEISIVKWMSFEEALNTITYDNTRKLFEDILKNKIYN